VNMLRDRRHSDDILLSLSNRMESSMLHLEHKLTAWRSPKPHRNP
jgi:hypothetical protein